MFWQPIDKVSLIDVTSHLLRFIMDYKHFEEKIKCFHTSCPWVLQPKPTLGSKVACVRIWWPLQDILDPSAHWYLALIDWKAYLIDGINTKDQIKRQNLLSLSLITKHINKRQGQETLFST